MKTTLPAVSLLLSDARGIYIPRDFAASFGFDALRGNENPTNPSDPSMSCIGGMEEVLNYFHENGNVWRLY